MWRSESPIYVDLDRQHGCRVQWRRNVFGQELETGGAHNVKYDLYLGAGLKITEFLEHSGMFNKKGGLRISDHRRSISRCRGGASAK